MVSFIFPSFKRAKIISGVIADLRNQTILQKVPTEILVTIDSNDPELELYNSYLDQIRGFFIDQKIKTEIILLINNSNGLVKAKNTAVRRSKYENIMMMDDDLYMENDYVEQLLTDVRNKITAAASGFIVTYRPAISHTQPSTYLSKAPENNNLQILNLRKEGEGWRSVFGSKEQVMNWSNIRETLPKYKRYNMDYFVNSYLFKKSAYDKIGGYNTRLNSKTSAHEEVDFTFRLVKAGYKLVFNPHPMMWHLTVGEGGIYKGSDYNQSKKILDTEYQKSLVWFIDSISK